MIAQSPEEVNKLFEENIHLAYWYARRSPIKLALEDRISACLVGLWEAAQRFDPDFEFQFSTYSSYRMKKCLFKARRDENLVQLPHHTRKSKNYQDAAKIGYNRIFQQLGDYDPPSVINHDVFDRDQLAHWLKGLNKLTRQIILLKHIKGYNQKNIAKRLKIHVATVSHILVLNCRP